MDANSSDKVLAFDSLFTTNHIQMLKILLPYLDRSAWSKLAVYIKLLELQYTLTFFQQNPSAQFPSSDRDLSSGIGDITGICDEIQPFCSPTEKEKLQKFKNIFKSIENMQEMMQVMEMMRELSPELFSPGTTDSDPADKTSDSNPLHMFSGPSGMEIMQTMEMLQSIFGQNESTQK